MVSLRCKMLVKDELTKLGLKLIEDKKSVMVKKVKGVIIEMIYYAEDFPKTNDSDNIDENL